MENEFEGCVCPEECLLFATKKQKIPEKCPTNILTKTISACREECAMDGTVANNLLTAFTSLVGSGGASRSRLEHILEFSAAAGFKRIGVACCGRYIPQARLVVEQAKRFGFQSAYVVCKLGGFNFGDIGQEKESDWIICNPVGQAYALNDFGADINVTLGLCMGHDLLFNHYSKALVTNLVVKELISNDDPAQTLDKIAKDKYSVCPYMPQAKSES